MIGVTGCFSQQKKAAATPIQNMVVPPPIPFPSIGAALTRAGLRPGLRMPAYTIQVPTAGSLSAQFSPHWLSCPAVPAAGLSYTSSVRRRQCLYGAAWILLDMDQHGQSLTGPDARQSTSYGRRLPGQHRSSQPASECQNHRHPRADKAPGSVNQMQQRAQEQNNAMARSYGQRPQQSSRIWPRFTSSIRRMAGTWRN